MHTSVLFHSIRLPIFPQDPTSLLLCLLVFLLQTILPAVCWLGMNSHYAFFARDHCPFVTFWFGFLPTFWVVVPPPSFCHSTRTEQLRRASDELLQKGTKQQLQRYGGEHLGENQAFAAGWLFLLSWLNQTPELDVSQLGEKSSSLDCILGCKKCK